MRRVMVMAAVMALLVSAMSGSAFAGGKSGKKGTNVNPHIITGIDSLYTTYDTTNGTLRYFWKVAGLGKNGVGWITMRGEAVVEATCRRQNGSFFNVRERIVRFNEHDTYANEFGNATSGENDNITRPNAICTNNATLTSLLMGWDNITVELSDPSNHSTQWDYETLPDQLPPVLICDSSGTPRYCA